MAIPDNLRYLIEALRTQASPASTTLQSGPDAGTSVSPQQGMGPIEQRRDGYRLYVQETRANGDKPVSYEEWFKSQE